METERKVFLRDINQKIGYGEYQKLLDICDELEGQGTGDSEWIRARICFAKNELNVAEDLAIKAISKDPANYAYYRTLGEIIGAQGHIDAAKACLQGSRFDDYINKKYFPDELRKTQSLVVRSYEDQVLYNEPEKPLDEIIRFSDPTGDRNEFKATKINSTKAAVKVVEKGKVWFDGHNLCVYDQFDNLVDTCTFGNPALIERVRQNTNPTSIEGNLGVVVARSSGNYFHWTTDVMPGFHLLKKTEETHGKTENILVSQQERKFQSELMEAAGIDLQGVFCSNDTCGYYFSADKLIVPVFRHTMAMSMSEWAVDFIRSLKLSEMDSQKSGRRIYISRRDVASRGIDNEDEVISYLSKYGFEDVALDGKSVYEQMQIFQQSEYIVAPHGAGLTNIIYCKPGTTVFEFFGDFVQPCFRSLATICGLRYAHLSTSKQRSSVDSLEKTLNKNKAQRQNQRVDIDDLEQVFELMGLKGARVGELVV